MKKLYLHMGFHKTASTSFQETCKINKDVLSKQAYVYPLFNSKYILKKDIANHSIPIYSLYCNEPEKYHVNKKFNVQNLELLHKDYINTLESALQEEKNIILSGEDISLLDSHALLKLKSSIEKFNFEIVPFALVRSPYSFLCSMKQANIRQGNISEADFFPSKIEAICALQDVFPNIRFIPFNTAIKEAHGIIPYLFKYIGVNSSDFLYAESNESMSNALARILNIINEKIGKWKEGSLNASYFELIDFLETHAIICNSKYLLTEEEYLPIEDMCNRENTYFREHLGEEFCDTEIIFSEKDLRIDLFLQDIEKNCHEKIKEKELIFRYKKAINKYFIKAI